MSVKIPPRGVEPLNENQQAADNKALTETENPVFDTSLAILLQKYPELQEIISAWPKLPDDVKAEVKALVQSYAG
jgi:F0F1-type ATP synthase beta subunit